MKRSRIAHCAGASLIEVMLALALMAVNAMGLIAMQLWTSRETVALLQREQAVFLADAIAEAANEGQAGSGAARVTQWQARVAQLLPKGLTEITRGGGASLVQVRWARASGLSASATPESCGESAGTADRACAVMVFVP
ncbi:type IV pilus modification PilV family protein [Paraburkholderia hayleyella]|uniref:type IV pilus modification PilV family protein n=1 Tax=Paraburkholderia hayleyella TaxID=2152889 RepID=UPI0012923323|nr:hypothetical protein [Paraburkholderia hayleyella]